MLTKHEIRFQTRLTGTSYLPREVEAVSQPAETLSLPPPTTFFGFSHAPALFFCAVNGATSSSLSDSEEVSFAVVVFCSSADRAAARDASLLVSGATDGSAED